jgi:hypothetical protein
MKNPDLNPGKMEFFKTASALTVMALLVGAPGLSECYAAVKRLESPARGFISSTPAKTWEEGLISGNGTIGALVLSRALDETVIFSHERMFLPQGAPVLPPDSGARLFEIRRLIDKGLYQQASQLVFDISGQEGFMYPDAFVPAFDLRFQTIGPKAVSDYRRGVNFETGETIVQFSDQQCVYERRLFVSRADGVAVMSVTASKKGSVTGALTLAPRDFSDEPNQKTRDRSEAIFKTLVSNVKVSATGTTVTYRHSFPKAYPGSIHAIEGVAEVYPVGGTCEAKDGKVMISGADSLLVLIAVEPIYDPDRSIGKQTQEKFAALPKAYDTLVKQHAAIHGKFFNRVKLEIGGGADHALTTEELLAKSTNEKLNQALVEKQFDAGRYNIISSTGELPPNLQGLWGGTFSPGWASDYTHNGNVPSAIAATLRGNTPELMLAYISYIESIVPYLEINAKRIFGARGIVLPSRSTTHGFNNAFAPSFAGAYWVAGTPWAAHFFYDYYLFTGDKKFLADRALPFMEKCALFFEDYLYEGPDGFYVFSPTQSPENTPANSRSQASFNATMDIAATRELLLNTIAASEELGVNKEKIVLWKKMLAKLPPYQISKEGAVKEWTTPLLDDQLKHRHSSQLYALYDGMPEAIERDPAVQAGFRKIIDYKLNTYWKDNAVGFMSFGLVQLGQAATSLKDKELSYQCLIPLVQRYWLNNLASMHNHKTLFNMDISGGMPAVILKMLAEADVRRLQLLPALPKEWATGSVDGILCRGQLEIKRMQWSPEGVVVTLLSGKTQELRIEVPCDIVTVDAPVSFKTDVSKRCLKLTLRAEKSVTLKIKFK